MAPCGIEKSHACKCVPAFFRGKNYSRSNCKICIAGLAHASVRLQFRAIFDAPKPTSAILFQESRAGKKVCLHESFYFDAKLPRVCLAIQRAWVCFHFGGTRFSSARSKHWRHRKTSLKNATNKADKVILGGLFPEQSIGQQLLFYRAGKYPVIL